jgi:hypothetical protein
MCGVGDLKLLSPPTAEADSQACAQRTLAYTMRMKRANLVLDERLLDEALRLSGERTYSATVGRALEDFIRRARARKILDLAASGLWQGDLGRMRGDRAPARRRGRRHGAR